MSYLDGFVQTLQGIAIELLVTIGVKGLHDLIEGDHWALRLDDEAIASNHIIHFNRATDFVVFVFILVWVLRC